jgi:hypothetical protein
VCYLYVPLFVRALPAERDNMIKVDWLFRADDLTAEATDAAGGLPLRQHQ